MICHIKSAYHKRCHPCAGTGYTFELEMLIKPGPTYATNPEDNVATVIKKTTSPCPICKGKGYKEVRQ